ncbi:MAG: hypothetical protein CFE26_16740, partial [Verrucomicrobiales bacterium VVV1]
MRSSFLLALLVPAVLSGQSLLVRPYVQPGLNSTLQAADSKRILWLTDQVPGEFSVEFSGEDFPVRTVAPERVKLDFGPAKSKSPEVEPEQHYFKYTATLDGLPLDHSITYRVKQSGKEIGSGTFKTTASAGKSIRFV